MDKFLPIVEVHMSISHRCQRCGKFGPWGEFLVHWIYGKITGEVKVRLCESCVIESGREG